MITALGNPVYDLITTRKVRPTGRVLSGCSTNAALALAKLGERVRLVGAVGEDFRPQLAADLARHGIDHVIIPSAVSGGFALNYYDDHGNRTLDLIGRAAPIDPIDPAWFADAEAVLVGPILGEISLDNIRRIRRLYDGFFFCDPQGLLRGADAGGRIYHEKAPGIDDILGLFDVVKPNELEARVLTGVDCREDPYRAARLIQKAGPRVVIVTLAELGSVIYDGREFIDIPPYTDIALLDSTGAGDTYMAGFTFEYLRTRDLRRAGCFASCVSSFMIEHTGPDFPLAERAVRARQEELLALADYRVRVAVNR